MCLSQRAGGLKMVAVSAMLMLPLVACNGPEKRDGDPLRPVTERDFRALEVESQPALKPATDRTTEQLWKQAEQELEQGREQDAIITLHQIRLRDPWHFDANTLYQDVRLKSVPPERVYGEYRGLFADDMGNGAALYFMLRPLLLKASAIPAAIGDQSQAHAAEMLYGECVTAAHEGKPTAEARPKFDGLFARVPLHVAGHRLWQDMVMGEDWVSSAGTDELIEAEYAVEMQARLDRLCREYGELLVKHEMNGDARYLYERMASLKDPVESSLRYARDFLGGVGGYWMLYGLGRCAVDRVAMLQDGSGENSNGDSAEAHRDHWALLHLAELCYDACIRGDPLSAGEAQYGRGLVRLSLGRPQDAVKDFKAANTVLNGSDPELLALWIQTLGGLEEFKAAADVADVAMRLYPWDGHFVVQRVRMLIANGELERAKVLAVKAVANDALDQEYRGALRQLIDEFLNGTPGGK
jgi:tetratricopeptide (TPR) repeat protein